MILPCSVSQMRALRSQEAVTTCAPPLSHSAAVTTLLWPVRVFWGVRTTSAGATLQREGGYSYHDKWLNHDEISK